MAPPAALIAGLRPPPWSRRCALCRTVAGSRPTRGLRRRPAGRLIGYACYRRRCSGGLGPGLDPGRAATADPGAVKHTHVHARAVEQFAHRLHNTDGATGVLIFASLAERRVEIIADEDIHAKVGDPVWDQR